MDCLEKDVLYEIVCKVPRYLGTNLETIIVSITVITDTRLRLMELYNKDRGLNRDGYCFDMKATLSTPDPAYGLYSLHIINYKGGLGPKMELLIEKAILKNKLKEFVNGG